MDRVTTLTVSPQAFDRMQRALTAAEREGCDPEECVRRACGVVGWTPIPGFETKVVVDWAAGSSATPNKS